jgi:CBS domain-containing protein
MNARIDDLMVHSVMTTTPHQTVGHVKVVMAKHNVSCMPVVTPEGEPVGIVTSTDLIAHRKETSHISQIMSKKVFTVPQYADVSLAARLMRNHHIHHVIVTHEQRIVGIISSFDLLKLVEDHRFVMKNAPTLSKKAGGRRKKEELHSESET